MNHNYFPDTIRRTACLGAALLLAMAVRAQVVIQEGAGVTLLGGVTLSVAGDLNIGHGSLFMYGATTLAMQNGSVLSMGAGSHLWMDGDGGKFPSRLTAISGFFATELKTGAIIEANHAIFEKMSGNGLYLHAGAQAFVSHSRPPLLGCTFREGAPGSTLLRVDNNQHLTINGAAFHGGAGGATVGVAKPVNAGSLTFTNFMGNLAGQAFESDPYGLIVWEGETAVPENRLVDNLTVGGGDAQCFDAELVVTVQNTIVQGKASLYLVAGQRILLLPGFHVHEGGYLHAHITTSGLYCDQLPLMAGLDWEDPQKGGVLPDKILPPAWDGTDQEALSITVYPNPTAGQFSLALSGWEDAEMVTILVFDILGNVVVRRELPPASLYALDLTAQRPGLYVVRAVVGRQLLTSRIIRQ